MLREASGVVAGKAQNGQREPDTVIKLSSTKANDVQAEAAWRIVGVFGNQHLELRLALEGPPFAFASGVHFDRVDHVRPTRARFYVQISGITFQSTIAAPPRSDLDCSRA